MTTNSTHRRYVIVFIAACTVVLLPVVVLNYVLGLRSLGGGDVVLEASRWQEATHGVTYAPPLSANRPFKAARLFDRLPDINAIVFGSSTMMGVTQTHFPADIVMYNFSQTGNELPVVIGEAEFMQQRHPAAMKLAIVPLDWALGFIYRGAGLAGQVSITPPVVNAPAAVNEVSLIQQLQDALSLPRVKNLISSIVQIARAPSFITAFRTTFFAGGSEDYRCVDGTPARDFDTIFRGSCTGFRYDGSATFANLEAVSPRRVESLIASAVVPSSKYAIDLIKSGGLPHPQVLKRLDQLARDIRQSGGRLLLILPPLLPGMERAFLNSPHTGGPLALTKQKLAAWAQIANVVIIDAGQAERFGCSASEFVDEHHALPSCYARVFKRFWSASGNSTKLPAGLFTSD